MSTTTSSTEAVKRSHPASESLLNEKVRLVLSVVSNCPANSSLTSGIIAWQISWLSLLSVLALESSFRFFSLSAVPSLHGSVSGLVLEEALLNVIGNSKVPQVG
jgi:hypothetical protein